MKNKGFTLIELLAVIIIITVIAVITVPRINEQIEDSRRNIAKNSAINYKKTISEYALHETMNKNNITLNGQYNIDENGKIYNIDNTYDIKYDGTKPKNGTLNYADGELTTACITIGKYKITFENGQVVNTEKGTCSYDEIRKDLFGEEKKDGAKYLTTPKIIYLNPEDLEEECTESNSSSTIGTYQGCMKWYLYSIKGENANLMLDHNITAGAIDWASETDYNSDSMPITVGISYPNNIVSFPSYNTTYGQNNKGPLTALNTLKTLTTSWETSAPKIPGSISETETTVQANRNNNKYTIDYSDYPARLLTKEETIYLGCIKNQRNSCPEWMADNLTGDTVGTYGYWTSSPDDETDYFGIAITKNRTIDYDASYGIRPIITVPIEIID